MLFLITACAAATPQLPPPKPMPPGHAGGCPDDAKPHPDYSRPSLRRVPIQRIEPLFPARAYTERVQGWVCLRFAITAEGVVRDAVVTASAPQGYFEEAALVAVNQWTYQPAPSGSPGVKVLLQFAIAP